VATFRTPLKPLKSSPVGEQLTSLGEFIGSQRKSAELSLRQLAEQAGVSNPYLSQIERGLRKPSAEVLQGLARALRISAETLYVRAGILDPEEHGSTTMEMAILADTKISERQKQVLTDIYASFLTQNAADDGDEPDDPPAPTRRTAARTTTKATKKTPPTTQKPKKPTTSTTRSAAPNPTTTTRAK
jgi:transcriptional regulator with XRE-family HTH domain